MSRIRGRTALVTGASAGIGAACARSLAAEGADLVLSARRRERLESLKEEVESEHGVVARVEVLDVRDRPAVDDLAERLDADGIFVDILVNNAGLGRGKEPLWEGETRDWDEMVDTNVKGVLYVTRAFLRRMVEEDRGHVVFMGSTAGYWPSPEGNVYNATKYAVRGLTEATNMDLLGTGVRVSGIEPGLVRTEFSEVRFRGDTERAEEVYRGYRPLTPADVADAVRYVVTAPDHVDVLHMMIQPTAQRSPYHLDRNGGEG